MSQRQQCDMMVICTSVHSNGKCSQVDKLNGAQLHFPLPETGQGGKWFIRPMDTVLSEGQGSFEHLVATKKIFQDPSKLSAVCGRLLIRAAGKHCVEQEGGLVETF